MEKKVEYVREHYSKDVRKALVEQRKSADKENGHTLIRKKQRVWTLNRSPHGNKTAREQFGRQVWQRRLKRKNQEGNEDRIVRKKRMEKSNQYVIRKEIQTNEYEKR